MIVMDFEVFKHDWLVAWLDTNTRKMYGIINDREKLERMYNKYKDEIWVGFNNKHYDSYIAKAILCGFDPKEVSDYIILQERKGYTYSNLFQQFPIMDYDVKQSLINKDRSLKQLEGFMGHRIKESGISFDIDRKLTEEELKEVMEYCMYDVSETFEVMLEQEDISGEFSSHCGLICEFGLPMTAVSRTKAQISATILGAVKQERDDEFEFEYPNTLDLGRYEDVKMPYEQFRKSKNYDDTNFTWIIAGVEHSFGIGGIHGALSKYIGDGYYLHMDVGGYYPALMIEYDWLSRNVKNNKKFRKIRDERIAMKLVKDKRQGPRKIVVNGTFGASKDQYNALYDPRQANSICIGGQLLLVDLIDKIEDYCELCQSNTDGIIVKLYRKEDRDKIVAIAEEWCARTRLELEYHDIVKLVQRDVNNYAMVFANGEVEGKGYLKKLTKLDYDLPIVKRAVMDNLLYGKPVEDTILSCNSLYEFQMITKIGRSFDFLYKEDSKEGTHREVEYLKYKTRTKNGIKFKEPYKVVDKYVGYEMSEKVARVFASTRPQDGGMWKKKSDKVNYDKTAGTPEKCFIDNENVVGKEVPSYLDKQWYIKEAKRKIDEFYH